MTKKKDSTSIFIANIKVLFLSPFSKDTWMRVFGFGFYLSFILFIVSLGFFFQYLAKNKKMEISPEELAALQAEKKLEEDKKKIFQAKLGDFRMPYRSTTTPQGRQIPLPLANVEIVVRCNNEATCLQIEKNLIRVKDIVSSSLVPLSREELLSPDGKQKLKNMILEKLNNWLHEGEVIDVFFPKLILG